MKFNPDGSVEMSVEEFKAMNGVNPVKPMALSVASVTPALNTDTEKPISVSRAPGRKTIDNKEDETLDLLVKSKGTYPNGWSSSAIAKALGKSPSTVRNYLAALSKAGLAEKTENGNWVAR